MKVVVFVLALFLSSFAVGKVSDIAQCLSSAYPDIRMVNQQTIQFKKGQRMEIGTFSHRPFMQRLNNPSLTEQLEIVYPLSFVIPQQYQDPGRIRNDDFFKYLYGGSESEIRQNLVEVNWKPSGRKIRFNRLNGAANALEKVGNELAQYPDLIPYVNKSLGSFNFRNIAGTNRLSAHSFGISLDFQLPKHLHKYWRWDGCTSEDKICPYPTQLMNEEKLKRVVQIFEKNGFIWGGKWASYDSVHFEYRPELLIAECH